MIRQDILRFFLFFLHFYCPRNREGHTLPGLIFHSDRGVQYAAYAYRQRLASLGIRQSMSRKGDPYDNAVAENFFSCLKCECVHLRHFASRAHCPHTRFAGQKNNLYNGKG